MENLPDAFKHAALFQGIDGDDLAGMLQCLGARTQSFSKDSMVLLAGSEATHFGIVLSGRLQVLREEYTGERSIVAQLHPGELFAEAYACAPAKTGEKILPVSVRAAQASEVMFLDAGRIAASCSSTCGHHQKLIENMLGVLASKNLFLNRKMGHLSKRTTRQKVLSYLSEESARQGGGVFQIPFSQQELADYLCVERSGLSVTLSQLRREGIIRYDRSLFELCTPFFKARDSVHSMDLS